VGHVELMGKVRNAYRIFFGEPEGKSPLERRRRGLQITLECILGREGVAQDRELVNTVLNLRVP